jgi:hypothetical protein
MGTFATEREAWASGDHMVIKCTCGVQMNTCRCMGGPGGKPVNYVQDGCEECAAASRKSKEKING